VQLKIIQFWLNGKNSDEYKMLEVKNCIAFMGPCIVDVFFQVYQQDAMLYNILYYCQCSTCFRQFLHPSSGAQNCTHSIWYMSSLLAATVSVGELELIHASGSSKQASHIKDAVCTVLSS
jgi:hypothetical protein